jgi:hypothetical protein
MSRRRYYTRVNNDFITEPFSFSDVGVQNLNTVVTSGAVQINGIFGPCPVSVTGGEWQSASDGAFSSVVTDWTSSAGTILNGQYIRVRRTSSASYSTAVNVVLTVGSESDTFTITTKSQPAPVNVYFTTPGAASWTVPSDWNSSNNYVEVISGGDSGAPAGATGARANTGGGGGGYARKSNISLTIGASVSYTVGGIGGESWFSGSTIVRASGASGQTPGSGTHGDVLRTGGSGGNKGALAGGGCGQGAGGGGGGAFFGGDGGTGGTGSSGSGWAPGCSNQYGGGGGGSAGTSSGGSNGSTYSPGGGGTGGGATGGYGYPSTQNGNAGTGLPNGAGAGAGGGGGYTTNSGLSGGLYGGGGGGNSGSGAQGIIHVWYQPV